VDQAAYVKADFLTAVAQGNITSSLISAKAAVELLGTMMGGYNVRSLMDLLSHSNSELAQAAANGLKKTLLVYDAFHDIQELAESGNSFAQQVMQSGLPVVPPWQRQSQ
jgi:aconitate hydratase 2 / 2-methylisocitrate dehydratase